MIFETKCLDFCTTIMFIQGKLSNLGIHLDINMNALNIQKPLSGNYIQTKPELIIQTSISI